MNPNPQHESDISPMFSPVYHSQINSRLNQFCDAAGISIHDRFSAYEEMKRIENEYIFKEKP